MNTLTALTRPSARRPRGGPRGFTLLELVVVAAVSSILFLILIRWVLTLGAASSVTLDNAAAQRNADVARDAFAADVSRAAPCAPGEYSALRSVTPDKVTFTVPNLTNSAFSDLVIWQVKDTGAGHALQRTVAVHAAGAADPCQFATAVGVKTYADNIEGVATDEILAGNQTLRPGFYAASEGQSVTDPAQAWGDCAKHQNVDRCSADGIGVNWLLRSPVDRAAPIAVTRTFMFASTGGALS